jgi:HEAT repeat protein
MKTSARIGLVTIALLAVTAVVFKVTRVSQPEHNKKSVTDLMIEWFYAYPRRNAEAIQALRAIGDPAVRQLAMIVEREDSAVTKKLLEHADRIPVIAEVVPSKYWYRTMAAMALGELGTNASSAVPALRKMANDSDANLARVAAAALVLVQNESIGKLISVSLDHESTNATKAYGVILWLGPHAKEGIPAYLEELESTNSRIRTRALTVLGLICTESPECVPVFTKLLTDPNGLIRTLAIHGLSNCGEMAKSSASAVAELVLKDPTASCRSGALIFLKRVVPASEFEPFASLVRRATNDVEQVVRDLAWQILNEKQSNR